jgi:hypothetical protein
MLRWLMPLLSALASLMLTLAPSLAAEPANPFAGRTVLVMVDDRGCSWCRKWDREVGVGYGKSDEGKRAPLVRFQRGDRRLARYPSLGFTPTFLLLVNGEERGRIVGYPGADFFWGELGRLLQKTPAVPENRAGTATVKAL